MTRNHGIFFLVTRIVSAILGLSTTVILTRLLDPYALGVYGLALAVAMLASSLGYEWIQLAFSRLGIRPADDGKSETTFVVIFLSVMIIFAAPCALFLAIGQSDKIEKVPLALGVALATCSSWLDLVARAEAAQLRPIRFAAMTIGRSFLVFMGTIFASLIHNTAQSALIGAISGGILTSILFALSGAFPSGRFRWANFDRTLARKALIYGLPLCLSMALDGLVSVGLRFQVQIYRSTEELGFYTASILLVQNTLVLIGMAIAVAGYSLAVQSIERGEREAARRHIMENGELVFALIAPAALGLALTSKNLAELFSGAQFAREVEELIPLMALGALFFCIRAGFLDHAFQLGHRTGLQMSVAAVTAVVSNSLGFFLIPQFGAQGAALAFAVAMAVSCFHAYVAGKFAFELDIPFLACVKVLVSCLAMAVMVNMIDGDGAMVFAAQIVVGVITYSLVAVSLNVLGSKRAIKERVARWRASKA